MKSERERNNEREEEKCSRSQRDELVDSLQTALSVCQWKDYIHPLLH